MQQIEKTNLVTCDFCSAKVPIREMKFDMSGTELICTTCYEKQKSRSTSSMEKRDFGPSLAIERREERAQRAESYISYRCDTCKYSFSRKESFNFRKCPNCGSQALKATQKNTAQKILDHSSEDKDPDLGIEFL